MYILGERKFRKIEVLSFTRLCDYVFRKVGQKLKKNIDDGGRNMFMSMAIESVKDKLNLYKKNCNNMEIVELMISTLKEFRMSGLSDEKLLNICDRLGESTLKEKVCEARLILNKYTEMLCNRFSDPLENLDILERSLSENNVFAGYSVFLDSFNGFTVQQMNVLKHIIRQSSEVYFTFCTDSDINSNTSDIDRFSSVNKNMRAILNISKECGVNDVDIIRLGVCKRFKNNELSLLEEGLFCTNQVKSTEKTSNIVLFNACNIYDECDFIAREIRSNVMKHSYRYKDFAVIGRDINNYIDVIENVFKKYDINYFFDEPESISKKSLMSLVLSAFDVIHSNYGANEMFRYLKTGLVGLNTEDISIIENYVLLWEIRGEKWKSDFRFNPNGFGYEMDEESKEELKKINEIREKIIIPLENFEKRIKKSTGEKIAQATYLLMEEIDVADNVRNLCETLKDNGELSEAEEQARLWDILMEAINQTAIVIGTDSITSRRYRELLEVVMESGDISFIPRGLDEVIIGSVDRIRVSEPKITFVIGAVDGEFPRTPVQAGIFSDIERKKLISMGLSLYDTLDDISINERFLVYFALTSASEKLYISWPSSNINGSGKLPSEIIREVRKIFPDNKIMDKYCINTMDNFWSEKSSFEICASKFRSNDEVIATLKYYFKNNVKYQNQINAIERVIKDEPLDFRNADNAKELFGNKMKVSASQIEKYHLCRFYYFCKYGLRAKERKAAKFNAMEYGSLIHYVLEGIFSKNELSELWELNDLKIKNIIKSCMDEYVDKKLGGLEDKPPRFKYLYLRCADVAYILIKRIIEEFKQSKFVPSDYEAEISDKGTIRPLKLKLLDGSVVEVEGKIDRIDVMESEGKSYVRIVDYKTGVKTFKLSDILYGLNMQMMVYMAAICNNGYKWYKNIVPAGILYMPAVKPTVSVENGDDEQKLIIKSYKKLCMNGIILDNKEVIEGMESGAKGLFIPAIIKNGEVKKDESIASLAQIGIIIKYVEKLIRDMAQNLREGKVSSRPLIIDNEHNSCKWCPYGCVCGYEDETKAKKISKFSNERTLEKMMEEESK